jgi:hypothetical protein
LHSNGHYASIVSLLRRCLAMLCHSRYNIFNIDIRVFQASRTFFQEIFGMNFSSFLWVLHTLPISFLILTDCQNVVRSMNYESRRCPLLRPLLLSVCSPKYGLVHVAGILAINRYFSLRREREQISHPYKATNTILILYIVMFGYRSSKGT